MPFRLALTLVAFPLAAAADVFTFETPSGNIDCSVGLGEAPADIGCVIYEREGPPAAPAPAGCASQWGHVFTMRARGPVEMACQDVGRNTPAFEIAPYGVSAEWEGISCHSSEQGFECRNLDGHGFFLSRRSQRVF